jgi:lipoprotein NlpD
MNKTRFFLLAILSGALAGCGTTRAPAPVVERTVPVTTVEAPPQTGPRHADSRGYYTIRKGDTLHQIALDFGQNYRDLVAWNNLANANDIKVGQQLRVVPPEGQPQTGSVSTSSGVEVRPLTQPPAAANTASNKTAPRGDKRPYSESALAELQKQEGGAHAPTQKGESKTGEKGPESTPGAGSEDDNISWMWPAEGKIVAGFSDGKKGIDIAGKMGEPVVAAGAGKVLYAGSGIRGYGNLVIVKHSNNLLSAYAHNKVIFVKEDQTVTKGQKIAEMGNSDSDTVKLHFEIRQQGKPVDPTKFLPSR